ncbi:MAG TPA: hypothetical protein VMF30_06605, partial [Pirellulales bacterium]|nr:hypothetical protein [Pirellulales bacterium]
MSKKPLETSHKSRFETLEERRMLSTTYTATDPFTQNGSADNGEAALGDSATIAHATMTKKKSTTTTTGATVSGYYNNNTGRGGTDDPSYNGNASNVIPFVYSSGPSGTNPVWDFGYDNNGDNAYNNNDFSNFNDEVFNQPSLYGTSGTAGKVNFTQMPYATDGTNIDYNYREPGLAGFETQNDLTNTSPTLGIHAVSYNYGNNGLNGNGSSNPVPDPDSGIVNFPTGALVIESINGPTTSRFIAPTTGSYTLSTTFTDPMFDPYQGFGGESGGDFWTWNDGQPGYAVILNGSSVLADGFSSDIASVNQADVPTVGHSIGVGSGLSINSGATGGMGPSGNHGTGGTWTLVHTSTDLVSPQSGTKTGGGTFSTNTEFDMQWSYSTTLTLTKGETVDFDTVPLYDGSGDPGGITTAPVYLSASMTAGSPTINPPTLTVTNPTPTVVTGGTAATVDAGITVSSTDSDISGATMSI